MGTLETFDLRARERPLADPRASRPEGAVRALRPAFRRTAYPPDADRARAPTTRSAFDGYLVSPFPVKHRVEAYGYAFVEAERPGRSDVEAGGRSASPTAPT